MSSFEEFFARRKQYQQTKEDAEKNKINIIKVFKLVPYTHGGTQKTRFTAYGIICRNYHDDAFKHHDTINNHLAELEATYDNKHTNGIYLLVERLYSVAGTFYYPDGTLEKPDAPTEGYLRVRINAVPANNVWVYVNNVRGGIESTPASASCKLPRPDGWNGYRNKNDIVVTWDAV